MNLRKRSEKGLAYAREYVDVIFFTDVAKDPLLAFRFDPRRHELTGGKMAEAEKIYERVLEGYKKAWVPEHTSTFRTVNNSAKSLF